jgi:hypothetical protein
MKISRPLGPSLAAQHPALVRVVVKAGGSLSASGQSGAGWKVSTLKPKSQRRERLRKISRFWFSPGVSARETLLYSRKWA